MNIEQLLKKLKTIEAISQEDCIDFCIDCLEVLNHNQQKKHYRQNHMVIHQCFENAGVSYWIDCIQWLQKKGYLKEKK